MTRELTCEDLLAYVSDYIDGELDDALSAAAQHHLVTCENCRVVLDSTQRTILLYKERNQQERLTGARKDALYDRIAAAFASKEGE